MKPLIVGEFPFLQLLSDKCRQAVSYFDDGERICLAATPISIGESFNALRAKGMSRTHMQCVVIAGPQIGLRLVDWSEIRLIDSVRRKSP